MIERPQSELEEHCRKFIQHVEDVAAAALSDCNKPYLEGGERVEVEKALGRLRLSFDELAKWFVEPLRDSQPGKMQYGYEKLWALVSAAYLIGSRGTITDAGRKFSFIEKQSASARKPRKKKTEADALDQLALDCWDRAKARGHEPSPMEVWGEMQTRIEDDLADASLSTREDKIVLERSDGGLRRVSRESFSTIFGRLKKADKR
jgi:hypothetical protein